MIDVTETPARSLPPPPPRRPNIQRRVLMAATLLAAVAVGAGATALIDHGRRATFVALTPAPITAMKDGSPVAVKGQVAEIFGNKFVLADDTGRALIETGRDGEESRLVAQSEAVTVQGRFENGFVHAFAIQHGDGKTDVLGPPGPPPPGHLAWLGSDGPHGWFARRF